ncbi:MAG: LacI family transcriptional regulator [Candidatus Omnitrophica bacterium]|nr:LacI family transcriptional regulator [Candidatus Omnitrophota bacterium]
MNPASRKKPTRKERRPLYVLIIPRFEDLGNSFYAGEVTKGVNLAASRLDVDVLVHFTERKDHSSWLAGSLTDPFFVDGILFADIDRDWEVVKRAIHSGMPTMVLNNATPEPFNCIAIDNRQAAKEAVQYLLGRGHTRIAHIAGDLNTQAGQDRLEGYYEALSGAGIPKDKHLVKKGGFLRTPARTAAQALLGADKRPTAIFAASDLMALEVINLAKNSGLKIPEDISVVGFDNNMSTIESTVRLTTFEQPITDMARLGLENLYQMSLGLARLPVKITLGAKFVQGKTVAESK